MSLFSKLFGGGSDAKDAPSEPQKTYKGFAITPNPMKEGGQWRVAALIQKDEREHQLIRADTIADKAEAETVSLNKAKQMIDEQGDQIFG